MPATTAHIRLVAFRRHLAGWTLQSWLAMFFAGAAYAKLTEPAVLLQSLLHWTALVDGAVVRTVGLAEMVLAFGVLAPLLSWRWGRPVMSASLFLMAAFSMAMLSTHLALGDLGMAAVNLLLLMLVVVTFGLRAEPNAAVVSSRRERVEAKARGVDVGAHLSHS